MTSQPSKVVAGTRSGPAPATTSHVLQILSNFGLALALLAIALTFSALKPETFGTWDNLRAIASNQVTIVFLAFAATLPLIVGGFDLSIAAVFTFAQVLTVGLVLQHHWAVPAAIGLTLAAAAVIGLINGLVVAKLNVNSFISTLAAGSVVTGITLAYTKGESIYGEAPDALTSLARNSAIGIPLPIVYALGVALCLAVLLARFPTGRRMYAIGANRRAAMRTGIPAVRYVAATFVGSSLLAAAGGILIGSRLGAASSDAGSQLLIPAFAAAFLGATTLTPGRFNIPGTLIAVYLVGVLVTGLQQLGVALWVEPVVEGALLLLALALSAWLGKLRRARARAARLKELELRASTARGSSVEAGMSAVGSGPR